MCLLFFDWQPEGGAHGYKLIVASNRDEFFARPTHDAHWWPQTDESLPDVYGGMDAQPGRDPGGTWLALSRSGRFTALTNFRRWPQLPEYAELRSRGAATAGYLRGQDSPDVYAKSFYAEGAEYGACNILVGRLDNSAATASSAIAAACHDAGVDDGVSTGSASGTIAKCSKTNDLWYAGNQTGMCERVTQGVHGLCNGALDEPWPKLVAGKSAFAAAISRATTVVAAAAAAAQVNATESATKERQSEVVDKVAIEAYRATLISELEVILGREEGFPDEDLPSTGVPLELERALSPICIRGIDGLAKKDKGKNGAPAAVYGTRAHSVVLVGNDGCVHYIENARNADTGIWHRHEEIFQLEEGTGSALNSRAGGHDEGAMHSLL